MPKSKIVTGLLLGLAFLATTASAGYKVEIATIPEVHFGQNFVVDVTIEPDGATTELGGFELWVSYDPVKLQYVGTQQGDFLTECAWESFSANLDPSLYSPCCVDCGSVKLLQLVSLADINNGAVHPSCWEPTEKTTLAKITFQAISEEEGQTPLYFYWKTGEECSDNVFSDRTGYVLLIGDGIYDNGIFNCSGPDPACENPPAIVPDVDFYGGWAYLAGTWRGDVNRNDIPYDLGDAMVLSQYFTFGLSAFRINPEEQIAATDVNCDGYVLTVADLVVLQQIIAGTAEPPPCGE